MLQEPRKLAISERNVSQEGSLICDKATVVVTIENTGSATIYIGWNENATEGKGVLLPGASRSYGFGWPYFLSGQKINYSFGAVGSKAASIVFGRDAGEHCDIK